MKHAILTFLLLMTFISTCSAMQEEVTEEVEVVSETSVVQVLNPAPETAKRNLLLYSLITVVCIIVGLLLMRRAPSLSTLPERWHLACLFLIISGLIVGVILVGEAGPTQYPFLVHSILEPIIGGLVIGFVLALFAKSWKEVLTAIEKSDDATQGEVESQPAKRVGVPVWFLHLMLIFGINDMSVGLVLVCESCAMDLGLPWAWTIYLAPVVAIGAYALTYGILREKRGTIAGVLTGLAIAVIIMCYPTLIYKCYSVELEIDDFLPPEVTVDFEEEFNTPTVSYGRGWETWLVVPRRNYSDAMRPWLKNCQTEQ